MKEIKVNKLNKNTTIEIGIKLTRQFYVRMWVGRNLISLAALVMGCGIKFNDPDPEE